MHFIHFLLQRPTASTAATVMQMVVNNFGSEVNESSSQKPVHEVVARVHQERVMFQQVLSQSLALMCQLTLGSDKENGDWDVKNVMRFLFLSRLTYRNFKEAMMFF